MHALHEGTNAGIVLAPEVVGDYTGWVSIARFYIIRGVLTGKGDGRPVHRSGRHCALRSPEAATTIAGCNALIVAGC